MREMFFDAQKEGEHFPEHCIVQQTGHTRHTHTQFIQEVQWDNGHLTSHMTQNLHVSTSTAQIIVHTIHCRAKIIYISVITESCLATIQTSSRITTCWASIRRSHKHEEVISYEMKFRCEKPLPF